MKTFLVLLLFLSTGLTYGCALVPPNSNEVADICAGKVASVQTSDNFTWRFLGFSAASTRRAECQS